MYILMQFLCYPRMARTSVMAELLDSLNQINLRLQPYMQRYQQFMQDDPTFDQNVCINCSFANLCLVCMLIY